MYVLYIYKVYYLLGTQKSTKKNFTSYLYCLPQKQTVITK
jgi:hypothetical protein